MLTQPWAECCYPKLGQIEKIHGRGDSLISELLLGPYTPNCFEVSETHRNISRLFGTCWLTHGKSDSTQNWAELRKIYAGMQRSVSQLPFGLNTPNVFGGPETHRNISTSLGRCWPTHGQSDSIQTLGQVEQTHGGGRRSIFHLLLGPPAPIYLEVPERHWNISRSLGRCWHTCRQSAIAQNLAEFSKYMGEWGGQYLSFY